MNRCNKNLACQEKCSCVKKVKRKRTKTKPKIKAPILPNMTISNASQFPLQAQNLAQNIAHFLRPQISGIMQNTRPRTLMEDRRIQTIFETADMGNQTTQDTVDMGTQSKPSTIDTSSQIRPRMYEMGTQPERPILSVGRLEPINLLPREPIRETLIPEVREMELPIEQEEIESTGGGGKIETEEITPKRGRGRPAGSKNKPKRVYEMGTQTETERPILSVGRLEPINLLPREPERPILSDFSTQTETPLLVDFYTQTPGGRIRAGKPAKNEPTLTASREEDSEEEIIFFP